MGNIELYMSLGVVGIVFLREGYNIAIDCLNRRKYGEEEIFNVVDLEEFRERKNLKLRSNNSIL